MRVIEKTSWLALVWLLVHTATLTWRYNFLFTAEITMFDNYVVVYKFVQDLHFFVTGGENENEIILATVLQGFFDAVGNLLRFFHNTFHYYYLLIHMCVIFSCLILSFFPLLSLPIVSGALWTRRRHWRT